jgi:predicted dehydrogenase
MGALHARTVAAHPDCELATCVDIRLERAHKVAEAYGGIAQKAVTVPVDAAVVAVPTSQHVVVARPLLERGVWCLIEKPIDDGSEIWTHPLARVGHVERFNQGLQGLDTEGIDTFHATRRCLPPGRTVEDDVFLDLLVHDLDLVLQWVDLGPLLEARAHTLQEGKAEEAMARWAIKGGGEACFEVSRLADKPQRLLRWEGNGEQVDVDLLNGRATRDSQEVQATAVDALTAQWRGFVDALLGGNARSQPATCEEARAAVNLALEARQVAMGHR